MSEENKTVELKEEDLEKVNGGTGIETLSDVLINNWYTNGPDKCFYVTQIVPSSWYEIKGYSYNNLGGGGIGSNPGAQISFSDFKNNYTLSAARPDWLTFQY